MSRLVSTERAAETANINATPRIKIIDELPGAVEGLVEGAVS